MFPNLATPPPGRTRLLTLALVAVAAGCGGSGKPSSLPIEDDFSTCSTGWSTDTDDFVSLSCTDGSYRVRIKNPQRPQNARLFFSKDVTSLNVEADATRHAGPKAVGENEFLVYGVGCWASPAQGYIFLVSPGGDWGIEKVSSGASLPTALAESAAPGELPALARTARVRGVCAGGGAAPTKLILYVNGKKVGAAEDRTGFDSFPGFGFFVFSSEGDADVGFDNLVAREPTKAEVRRATAKPTLCKRDGIRYAGTTAQGAEVCFTLTRDGHGLVETAFSFVAASGCPDGATGNTYSDYPGEVDAAGQLENPDGLTGTVRGAAASGVISDETICAGKTFTWTARRQP